MGEPNEMNPDADPNLFDNDDHEEDIRHEQTGQWSFMDVGYDHTVSDYGAVLSCQRNIVLLAG